MKIINQPQTTRIQDTTDPTGTPPGALHGAEMPEINDIDLEEIAQLVKDGYTSGRLDDENGKRISWKLELKVWMET